MKRVVSSLLVLGLASASTAFADTYYVPRPYLGGVGKSETKLEMSKGGPRQLRVTFIPAGQSGTGMQSTAANVDNDKANIFNVSRFVAGPGLIRLENNPGPTVRVGTIFLSNNSASLSWATPVLTPNDWFQNGETAYVQNLARTGTGHSNIEIANASSSIATCQLQLLRPAGTLLGAARTIPVKPLSLELVEDPLLGVIEGATGAGVRAQVSCNQPFYAYGTFVDPDVKNFRMLYPFDRPPVPVLDSVTLERPGAFFSPSAKNSHLLLDLPLVPEQGYRQVTIDFDMSIKQFTPIFTGILGMFHAGGGRFNKTLYFGTFIRGLRNKTMIDQGSPVLEPTLKVSTGWKQNALHHVTIVYDAENATVRMMVTRAGAVILDTTGSAYNLDIANRGGNPVKLSFGLPGVADHAYYPPVGWKFSNLKVVATR
jgi:hypothetical protein